MRKLVALVAGTMMLVASGASANVFDPSGSELHVFIGALTNDPVYGDASATSSSVLTGGAGAEVITIQGPSAGGPIFQTANKSAGAPFFTGTPSITNLFLTVQNATGTFSHGGADAGTFLGNPICTGCFGGISPLIGQDVIDILDGFALAPVQLAVIGGAGGTTSAVIGALSATVFVKGGPFVTAAVPITGIASNVVSITNGPRAGVTGVGFTLQQTVNENNLVLTENGVTGVTIAGSTDFTPASPATSTAGINQVTLVSPAYIDAGSLTGNPPLPGAGIMVLRYVPEPGTMLLLGSAVAGLLVVGRKRMKR